MPFQDQPGLAAAAGRRAQQHRRERARDRITAALRTARPGGATVHQLTDPLNMGVSAVRRTLNGMCADGLTVRDRANRKPPHWHYTLTAAGLAADHTVPSPARPTELRGSVQQQRDRTRAIILADLDVWPIARTARHIAAHTGMSISGVRRALAPLVDTGDVLMTAHPFHSRLRTYHLPYRGPKS